MIYLSVGFVEDMTSEHLLILTRYPEIGQVKTRLIPALGAEGATALHQQMVEHTFNQARSLCLQRLQMQVTVLYAGEVEPVMVAEWLGAEFLAHPQALGDLGDRLVQGFDRAFTAGAQKVLAIGTDCPGLNASLLEQALVALDHQDVVLGPALDGGYYLIGLRSQQPQLFQGITWGTGSVLEETLAAIQVQHLNYSCLTPLADVDRPEDLPVWTAVAQQVGDCRHKHHP